MSETPLPSLERVHGMFLNMALIRAFDEAAGEARRDGSPPRARRFRFPSRWKRSAG